MNFIQEIKKSYQLVLYVYKHRKDTQQEQLFICEANKPLTMMPKPEVVLQIFQPNIRYLQILYEQVSSEQVIFMSHFQVW